jgi:cytochrome c peroxidase
LVTELLLAVVIPLGLDLYLPVPDENPLTAEKIELGRQLFSDARLSADGSISCATCHDPARAFSSEEPVAVGVFGRVGRRNAPAIINRGYGRSFFWDGRTTTLEEQVLRPIADPLEMGADVDEAAARVGLSRDELSRALASFVRSLLVGGSRFDRFINGDRDALTEEEQAGLRVFRTRGRCAFCHSGPTFTDEEFHNTGVAWSPATTVGDTASARFDPAGLFLDEGRWLVTAREADRGAFKTPTLREVGRTAPYMHDGSLATLEAVVDFYDGGGRPNPNLDADIRPIGLRPDEKRALVAFLRALGGPGSN